jgi:superoxide dismutase
MVQGVEKVMVGMPTHMREELAEEVISSLEEEQLDSMLDDYIALMNIKLEVIEKVRPISRKIERLQKKIDKFYGSYNHYKSRFHDLHLKDLEEYRGLEKQIDEVIRRLALRRSEEQE